MTRRRETTPLVAAFVLVAALARPATVPAQSLEEQTRRPPGTSSLDDDSERMRDAGPAQPTTDSLDDDSETLRGRTADQNPTNSLDDGSLDGGNDADPGDD